MAGCILIGIWLVLLALLVRDEAMESRAETPAVRSKPELRAEARREWMEIYVAEKKVGYAVTRVSPAGEGYAVTEETFLKLNLLGRPSALRTTLQALVDSDFRLRRFRFAMVSGAVRYHLRGRVSKGTLYLEQGEGGKGAVRKLKLDVPPMIGAGLGPYLEERGLRVGDEMSLPLFDPSTLSRNSMRVRVVGRERVRIHRIDYDAFRLEARMWGRTMTLWVDEKGSILKQEGLMGMTLVRSSAANAPRGITSGGDDFYDLAAVGMDVRLNRPDRLSFLKLRLGGVDLESLDRSVLGSGRQRLEGGVLEVRREKVTHRASYVLPYKDVSGAMKAYLGPELNVESDHPSILHKAREILSGTKEPVRAVRKLNQWVYRNLEKRPVVSVPSAVEVLKTLVGDCNEHATLLTALLRAAGVPARLCLGLVGTRGKFYYHAWVEAYLDGWVSVDPTLGQVPVDASHIKLAQGGIARQMDILAFMGKLKLEVLDYKYD